MKGFTPGWGAALEYPVLGFSVELPSKAHLVPVIFFQRHLSTWSPPENPISHWQPHESKPAIWGLKSWHYPSPATTSASVFSFFLMCSVQTKLHHTHPEYQTTQPLGALPDWNANEAIFRLIIRYETKVFALSGDKQCWKEKNHRPLTGW